MVYELTSFGSEADVEGIWGQPPPQDISNHIKKKKNLELLPP